MLGVPTLRDALGFGQLGAMPALLSGAIAAGGVAWFEGWKVVARLRERT